MQRRNDPWRPTRTRANKLFKYYTDERYKQLLNERNKKIALALNQTRSLPRDLQERIISEAGLFDMPPRGYYIPDYTHQHVSGNSGFY